MNTRSIDLRTYSVHLFHFIIIVIFLLRVETFIDRVENTPDEKITIPHLL